MATITKNLSLDALKKVDKLIERGYKCTIHNMYYKKNIFYIIINCFKY